MSSQNILRNRIRDSQGVDDILRNRSFGQKNEEQNNINTQSQQEQEVIRKIKDKINTVFGDKILSESKKEAFIYQLRDTIESLLSVEEGYSTNITKRKNTTQQILDDILGFGPIQDLLEDESITEIMVSRYDKIYTEKRGRLALEPEYRFVDEDQLKSVIEKIVQPIGRTIDESRPIVDARLPDGSRVNATLPPISPDGATLTIRKFSKYKLTGEDYLNFKSLSPDMLEALELFVKGKCNIMVSGGTGTGKTTLLNMISNFIPGNESIVTVEDSCELKLYQENVRRLEARPENAEGKGAIYIRDLVKNTLRMRPDRLVIGEVRDGVIVDLLRAMSSGHDGTLSTVHANSPKNLVESVIPILFGMSSMKFSEEAEKRLVTSALDLIVQIERMRDGTRKITNITHVVGYGAEGANKLKVKNIEENKVYLKDIFKFVKEGVDSEGKITGRYEATGYLPKEIIAKLEGQGISIPFEIFNQKE